MKHLVASLTFVVTLSIVLWSCIDVNQTNVPQKDFRSLVRFTHVAANDSVAGPVTVVGAGAVGTIGLRQSTPYINLPAGSHVLRFDTSSGNKTFGTDQQETVFLYSLGDTAVGFLLSGEGSNFKSYARSDSPLVKIINVATTPPLSFFMDSATGTQIGGAANFGVDNGYAVVSAGSHQIVVVNDSGQVGSFTDAQTFDSAEVYTVVAFNVGNTIQLLKLTNRQAGVSKSAVELNLQPMGTGRRQINVGGY